jgi:hypothetical protein
MTHTSRALLTVASVLLLAVPAPAAPAAVPSADALVGTWTLVLVDNVFPDGHRVQLYGPHPQGRLVLDARGRYSLHILRSDRPRFASGDKSQGTAGENRAAVQGANSHFGRYTVNAKEGTLTFHIDHASFPNWEGTAQTRAFTLEGDTLRYAVPVPTSGGPAAVGEVRWRRAP